MKNSYEKSQKFPEEQVSSAIKLGMAHAKAVREHEIQNKSSRKKHVLLYTVGSIAAAFIILIGFSHQSPALASSLSKIPIIGSVFGDSDLIGLHQAQEKGLTIQVGETQTVDGISVTLEEVLYDQNNITIGLKMESEEPLVGEYFGAGMDYTIDGEIPSWGSDSYGEEILSATSRTAIETISVTDEMPNEFDLGLSLQGNNGERWDFSFQIQQVKDIKKVLVNHHETMDGIQLDIPEFSYGDSGASISMISSEDARLADEGLDRASEIEFRIEDQDGNELKSHSGGVGGERINERIVYTSNKHFDPIDSGVTELTITPYLSRSTGSGVEVDENGAETQLEYKVNSDEPVEFSSFKVKIR